MISTPERRIAPVLFTCEVKGSSVPTGHRMRPAEFAAIAGPRFFRCGACGEIHSWTCNTAWLQGQTEAA